MRHRRLQPPEPAPKATAKKRARPPKRTYSALPGDRLVSRPVFILSGTRSGSTLLRVMLNTHSQIHAPHELHLGALRVRLNGKYVISAMDEIGIDADQARYLLWDRILHRELTRHGKSVLVNKTPGDVFHWRAIRDCWPDARFIFLLRHPAAVADSLRRAHPRAKPERPIRTVLRYGLALEGARTECDGVTVRYEDITSQPEKEMRRICEYLGLDYEPAMVDYGSADHGSFKRGLGDWSASIRSGTVRPARELPPADQIPPEFAELCAKWGY